MIRTKAVHFMKEKGFIEVKGRDTRWTDTKMLILHCPEEIPIVEDKYKCLRYGSGKDKYGQQTYLTQGKYIYEDKSFLPVHKDDPFPELDDPPKNCDKRNFAYAKVVKEHSYLKLLKFDEFKDKYAIELTNHKSRVFIDYDYYKYVTNENHCWRANEFRIKGIEDPILAYCDGMLLAMIMPIDLAKEQER